MATLNEKVSEMRGKWTGFRSAQLIAFFYASKVLEHAREQPEEWKLYTKGISGRETQAKAVELLLREDGDGESVSAERRAEWGAAIAWFLDCCEEQDDAARAVELARETGGITKIAAAWRKDSAASNPGSRTAKANRTKETSKAASAAKAATLDREIIKGTGEASSAKGSMPTKPEIIRPFPTCEANGDPAAMIEFLNRHGVEPGIRRDVEDAGSDEIYLYLRVLRPGSSNFVWYGGGVHCDLADQIADLLAEEAKSRGAKAEAA